ncbi:MAG: hypothetical protein L0G27_10025 [Paracoccus sp. (in: a-proteobacteria)]|nr:hypothetical protein [Paracoccus sp. (in: a-proteobacteria)]
MSSAIFKLESFSEALPDQGPPMIFTQHDLDRAYAQGAEDATAKAGDAQLRALDDALSGLARTMSDDETRRAHLRSDAVQALGPILSQIMDLMAPPLTSGRIEDALLGELTRLAQNSTPLVARIACSDRLRAMVERCLAQTGLQSITIAPAATDTITVTLQGGRITLDPDTITRDIHALISEITEDDTTWTH